MQTSGRSVIVTIIDSSEYMSYLDAHWKFGDMLSDIAEECQVDVLSVNVARYEQQNNEDDLGRKNFQYIATTCLSLNKSTPEAIESFLITHAFISKDQSPCWEVQGVHIREPHHLMVYVKL
jgi:hypothetical protein